MKGSPFCVAVALSSLPLLAGILLVAWGCRARRTRRAPGSGLPRARPGWSAWRFRGIQLRPGTGGTDVPMACIPAGSVRIPHGLVDVETLGTAILNARDYDESGL